MNGRANSGATKGLAATALLGLALLGCGDDDGGGGGGSPRAKCETLARTLCDRVVECNEERGAFTSSTDADAFRDNCERGFESAEQANCAAAERVASTYEQCLDELPRVACDLLLSTDENIDPTPLACRGVVLTNP